MFSLISGVKRLNFSQIFIILTPVDRESSLEKRNNHLLAQERVINISLFFLSSRLDSHGCMVTNLNIAT